MPINLSNDAFFNTEDFAVICRWTVSTTSDTYQVKAVFDNQFFEAFDECLKEVAASTENFPKIELDPETLPEIHLDPPPLVDGGDTDE